MKINSKGFSLIELMIVIGIIAILVAIATPQFMAYRMRAYNSAARAVVGNLKADQKNINSENGVYGVTEAAPANTTVAFVGAAAADSKVVAALAVASTGTYAGARLCSVNLSPSGVKTYSIGVALGVDMILDVRIGLAGPAAIRPAHYTLHAKHFRGDTAYAADSDAGGAIYTVSHPTAFPYGIGLVALPRSAIFSNDDFTGQSGGGSPTLNWTLLQ